LRRRLQTSRAADISNQAAQTRHLSPLGRHPERVDCVEGRRELACVGGNRRDGDAPPSESCLVLTGCDRSKACWARSALWLAQTSGAFSTNASGKTPTISSATRSTQQCTAASQRFRRYGAQWCHHNAS